MPSYTTVAEETAAAIPRTSRLVTTHQNSEEITAARIYTADLAKKIFLLKTPAFVWISVLRLPLLGVMS